MAEKHFLTFNGSQERLDTIKRATDRFQILGKQVKNSKIKMIEKIFSSFSN